MAKRKLQHFAEVDTFPNVIQQMYERENYDHPLKGQWASKFFGNLNPITLELGCGKGEYCVGLAQRHPERNYLGIDMKGNRLWRGAKTALEENIRNAGFLRTQIDRISNFFAPGEVSEIWITFPDPKPKKGDERKRFTSARMIGLYKQVLTPDGRIHLKTDSDFNYRFTLSVLHDHGHTLIRQSDDIDRDYPGEELLKIRTYYELKFRAKGVPIHYICFRPG